MVIHWWQCRGTTPGWARKLAVNGVGLSFTALILVAMLALKFTEGAWVTVLITGTLVGMCFVMRRHYDIVRSALRHLDDTLINAAFSAPDARPDAPIDRGAATAVLMVNGFNGIGVHSLLTIPRTFPHYFRNVVFVQVGVVDSSRFKGRDEIGNLEQAVKDDLEEYVRFVHHMGFCGEYRFALATDPVPAIERLCTEVAREFPRATFFAARLILQRESFFTRFLHNQTVSKVEQLLQRHGLHTVVLPLLAPV
jgi:hypothetical protein